MRIKRLADKVMWFVLGVVVAGLLLASSTSPGKVEAAQDIQQLERRIAALEERFRQMDAAAAQQRKQADANFKRQVEEQHRENKANVKKLP